MGETHMTTASWPCAMGWLSAASRLDPSNGLTRVRVASKPCKHTTHIVRFWGSSVLQPACEVGWEGRIDLLGVWQVEACHDVLKLSQRLAEAGVERLLLCNG